MTTIQEIKDLAEQILDQTIDDTLFLSILNVLKDRREEMRAWQFLLVLYSGDSASTSATALQTNFRYMKKLLVGSGFQPYRQVKFDEQHLYRNSSNHYFIDIANMTYTLLGNLGGGGTVYQYYIKSTPQLTALTDTLQWPARFWPLLAFDVAGYIMNGQDADDIFARMAPENKGQALLLEQQMIDWDAKLQIQAQGGRQGVADSEPEIYLGNM